MMFPKTPVLLVLVVQFIQLIWCDFEILILHTNDMHARFDETDVESNLITDTTKQDLQTFGGFARLKTALDQARAAAADERIPSLFLNAGDTFQGTAFYTLLKDEVVADLLPLLNVDLMCLGNHEFDDGPTVLAKYLEKARIPVVAANLDFKNEPDLQKSPFLTKSEVREIGGVRIGIIGYLTAETKSISSTGETIFEDEVESIRAEAEKLKNNGVKIIIALGHSGYEVDKKIAQEVSDVSLVIGGHTNTFLYNPPNVQLSTEKPEGSYPTIVEQKSGRKVPVVTAYAYTKYLGKLWITFDNDGNFVSARPNSNPILIDSSVAKDKQVQDRVDVWRSKINAKMLQVLGETRVYLDGWRASCKILECNLGNILTDSMIDYVAEKYRSDTGWTDAPIAICSSGAIRVSQDPNKIHGNMTFNEVLTFLPYRTVLCKLRLKGSTLRAALEHSVARYNGQYDKEVPNEFLQVSGIHVTYDMSKPARKRIVKVEVRCGNCTVPQYAPLDDSQIYGVIAPKFLADGGDNYTMISTEVLSEKEIPGENGDAFMSDTDSLARFIQKYKVVYPEVSGRIIVLNGNSTTSSTSASTFRSTWQYLTLTFTFVFVLVYC